MRPFFNQSSPVCSEGLLFSSQFSYRRRCGIAPVLAMTDQKPIVLQLGGDIKWNHDLYGELRSQFQIARSHSMDRAEFKDALLTKRFGDFVAMYRPFWSTGGEMGNWD